MKQGGRLNTEFDKLCVLILSYLKINIVFFILSTLYDCFFQRMVKTKLQNMMKTTVASEMTKMSLQMFTQDCLSQTNHGQTFEQSALFKSPQITFQDTCKFDGEPRVFCKGPHFKISSFHPDRIRVLSPPKKHACQFVTVVLYLLQDWQDVLFNNPWPYASRRPNDIFNQRTIMLSLALNWIRTDRLRRYRNLCGPRVSDPCVIISMSPRDNEQVC